MYWRVIDIRPATGWRVVYLHDASLKLLPLAGWLVCEEVALNWAGGGQDEPPEPTPARHPDAPADRRRAILPGVVGPTTDPDIPCGVIPAHEHTAAGELWRVLAPQDITPTAEEISAEVKRRADRPLAAPF